jgi:transcriptional regulator with XRE-family HTH domain
MTNEEIGRRLRKIREYRDMTQADLAKACNAVQTKISDIEKGYTTVSYADMGTFSKALHFNMDMLYHCDPFDLSACLKPVPLARVEENEAAE